MAGQPLISLHAVIYTGSENIMTVNTNMKTTQNLIVVDLSCTTGMVGTNILANYQMAHCR